VGIRQQEVQTEEKAVICKDSAVLVVYRALSEAGRQESKEMQEFLHGIARKIDDKIRELPDEGEMRDFSPKDI